MITKFTKRKTKDQILSLIFSAAIIVTSVFTASAQTAGTGALSGTITDQNQANVASAQIKVKNETSGEERTVVSNDSGGYVVPLLPPGTYRVEVTANGFKSAVHRVDTDGVHAGQRG